MANQYYSNTGHSQLTNKKVFINPNYNRKAVDSTSHLSTMYFNPHFSNSSVGYNSLPSNEAPKSKIYVNPNFLRNSNNLVSNQSTANYNSTFIKTDATEANVSYSNLSPSMIKSQPAIPEIQASTQIKKSRYCLVNKQDNQINVVNKVQTNTISVNKYKLVPLTDVKSKLNTERKLGPQKITATSRPQVNTTYKKNKPILQNLPSTRFKLIKNNTPNSNCSITKLKNRRNSLLNKSLTKTFSPQRKVLKGALKKNNIPCPLFKKYGTCLRSIRGTCQYLHDKKHVSICRKFLKGICHDELCLLSHDLTDKKMPTCYFYLQGACTKENCPYLHVKLNERASVCLDFLKGYCEKGNQCLNRHINVALDSKSKEKNKVGKLVKKKTTINIKTKSKLKTSKKDVDIENNDGTELNSVSEQRYFKETIVTDDSSDLIRPSRCKLGSLPSFIQL